MMYDRLKKYN